MAPAHVNAGKSSLIVMMADRDGSTSCVCVCECVASRDPGWAEGMQEGEVTTRFLGNVF